MHSRHCIEVLERRVLLSASHEVPVRLVEGSAVATINWEGQELDMFAGRWTTRFSGYSGYLLDQEAAARQTVENFDAEMTILHHLGDDGLFLVQTPQTWSPQLTQARLQQIPGFEFIVPDFVYELDATPNDPFFGNQWGLNNSGQFGGTPGVDIRAVNAWNTGFGNDNTVIAVVDSGLDLTHPDIAPNLWVNTLEIAGNGVDDDLNGYIDDVYGWNFWNNNNNPSDESDHGTHVGGIAGARGNNGLGISGVAWNVKLMAMKIGGSGTLVSGSAAVAAMFYIRNMAIRATEPVNVVVTNHSWGGPGFDPQMNSILFDHSTRGIMAVASAGNNGTNNDFSPRYPASYQQSNVIAVANLTNTNQRAFDSNYGTNSVHLAAPGEFILSTIRQSQGSYAFFSGTSMAAPFVSGAVAVIRAAAPAATMAEVKNAILNTVDPVPAFNGLTITGGRLNLNAALASIAVPATPSAAPDLTTSSDTGQSSTDNITSINTPVFQGLGQFGFLVKLYANGVQVGQVNTPPTNVYTVTSSALADGVYNMTVTFSNANGESGHSPPLQVTIDRTPPTVTAKMFNFLTAPHTLTVAFSENVAWTIANEDFQVENLSNSTTVTHNAVYNPNDTVTISFPNDSILPDARYKLTALASGPGGGIRDVAGNFLAADEILNFLFLTGDANNDGIVNLADFNILAQNFGQSGNYGDGDFNYDGLVNLADFNVLAQQFGVSLPPALASRPSDTFGNGRTATPAGTRAAGTFSTAPIRDDSARGLVDADDDLVTTVV